jgi:ORF6N domain
VLTPSKRIIPLNQLAIHLIRGRRVMLDSDLAVIYQVSTKRLNEQLRRNRNRFPVDFAFQLTVEELTDLRSQFATSNLRLQTAASTKRGGRRYLPWVFTEHGAIMLASVLNSDVAVQASVRVVRVFVRLREMVSGNAALAVKLAELERRPDSQDESIANLFQAIRQLLTPPTKPKREIGFHVREGNGQYRVRHRRQIRNPQSTISNP